MGMKVAVLLLVVFVGLTEGGCTPTTSPLCFKNSTNPDEDFTCKWEKRNSEENQTYTLHIWDSERKTTWQCNMGNQLEKYINLEYLGYISKKMDIWVQTQVGNLKCNSSKISAILECMVKYSKPQIISIKRSDGNLSLSLDKPKDNKSVIYEIRWRERDSEWQSATFETVDSTIQDKYTLHLHNQTVYQIQLRRQAKLESNLCGDSLHALWSDWSPVVDIPLEIRLLPVKHSVEKWTNGTRDVKLTWNAPSDEESFGGVNYTVSLSVWPCSKPKIKKFFTSNTTYNTSITYSEARITIIATNKVGTSPPQPIFIHAVKHGNDCVILSDTKADKTNKYQCLEWYRLEEGETQQTTVKRSANKKIKDIKNVNWNFTEVPKYVRHYYILHIKKKSNFQTAVMCPFYSKEGAPITSPGDVNISNLTHETAVVNWISIPVAKQQGFLEHYLIWISGKGNTTLHKVPANKTSFLIKNLHPGVSYTVSIAGRTKAGKGPNSTLNFETDSKEMGTIRMYLPTANVLPFHSGLSWQDQTILCICVVALLCTIICSVVARRFRSKLFPMVPSPVIDSGEFRCPQDQQNLGQMTEEVHEFVLLLRQDFDKPTDNVIPGQSTLLQDFGLVVFEEEDEEDEEGQVSVLSSMKSYPNPSYRGKTLQLPELFQLTDSTSKDSDTYRNGLFFETKVLECDKTSL